MSSIGNQGIKGDMVGAEMGRVWGQGSRNPAEITTHYSLTTSRQLKLYPRLSGDVGKASKRPIRAFPKLSGAPFWPAPVLPGH